MFLRRSSISVAHCTVNIIQPSTNAIHMSCWSGCHMVPCAAVARDVATQHKCVMSLLPWCRSSASLVLLNGVFAAWYSAKSDVHCCECCHVQGHAQVLVINVYAPSSSITQVDWWPASTIVIVSIVKVYESSLKYAHLSQHVWIESWFSVAYVAATTAITPMDKQWLMR